MREHKLNLESVYSRIQLSHEDIERIERLCDFELIWTQTDKLKDALRFSDEEDLIKWLRRQSINRVEKHNNKPVQSLTVIKTYSYDPVSKEAFVALCPLFTGRNFNWWD